MIRRRGEQEKVVWQTHNQIKDYSQENGEKEDEKEASQRKTRERTDKRMKRFRLICRKRPQGVHPDKKKKRHTTREIIRTEMNGIKTLGF